MIIYGIHPVEEVLKHSADRVDEVLVVGDLGDRQFTAIAALVDRHAPRTRRVSDEHLDRLAEGGNHQRVAVKVSSYPYRSLAALVGDDRGDRDGHRCIVALAQVQDPGNLGAILRSAAAMDVDAVMIPKHRSAKITPAVVRASAGMAFHVPIVEVTNLARALRTLKDEGFWVVGTVADEGQPLWTLDWEMDAVVVMGGEHQGMRRGVEKECDFRVTVPLAAGVESLNVSAAAAIALYDRQRTLLA